MPSPIKVLIVDDAAPSRQLLSTILRQQLHWQVVGQAKNGREAIDFNSKLRPDLIIMHSELPLCSGLEATQQIMQTHPTAILIFTPTCHTQTHATATQAGATAVMQKPTSEQLNSPVFIQYFCKQLLSICSELPPLTTPPLPKATPKLSKGTKQKYQMVVMGASTGGPIAVNTILKSLPATFPIPIVLVQHLEVGFDQSYVDWLNADTALNVTLACHSQVPQPGSVVIAPATQHLIFGSNLLQLDDGPRVLNQKPAVDRLFETAAAMYRNQLLGVLLTGMGRDGANGCVAIKKYGGYTIIQNQESCTIFGMPKSAIEQGGANTILPLTQIAEHLLQLTGAL